MDSYPGSVAPGNAREPCPDRIADDVGGAFAMGAIGGSVFHFIKGVYQSPKGDRFTGGLTRARMDAPRTGGSFAVWGGLFSTFDCTMVYLRQKEDPWNSVVAGAATGGFLSLRQGPRQALASAAFGGILLGMIEGVGIMLNKMQTTMAQSQLEMPPNGLPFPNPNMPPLPQAPANEGSSWGSGLLGWGKKEESGSGSGSKDQILDNFEIPSSPGIPQFPDHVQSQPQAQTQPESSWGSGLFGWRKKQESTGKGDGSKVEILESYDSPNPPMPYR